MITNKFSPFAVIIIFLQFCIVDGQVNEWQSHFVLQSGQISGRSEAEYMSIVKCFFIVYGEMSHGAADSACRIRNATLATFSTKTEERLVRKRIDWSNLPGYEATKKGKTQVVGQLWVGVGRSKPGSNRWEWKTDHHYQGSNFMPPIQWVPTDDPYEDSTVEPPGPQDCAVIRQEGWAPLSCDGFESGDLAAVQAGALCNTIARIGPTSDATTNFCGVPLMPYSTSNLAIPLVLQKNYFMVQGNFTWQDAFDSCDSKGAQLATVKSYEEFVFIRRSVDIKAVGFSVWISLRRTTPRGFEFVWASDDSGMGYNGFLPGQPGFDDDCIAYQRNNQGAIGWASMPCNATLSTINLPMSALCETFRIL